MSDYFGRLFFSQSNDCKYDAALLLERLNSYLWVLDGETWEYDTSIKTFSSCHDTGHYPTTLPSRIKKVLVRRNDMELWIDYEEFVHTEEEMQDTEEDEVDLESLCKDIASAITTGWIEIAATGDNGRKGAYVETLQIHSSGEGVRQSFRTGLEYPNSIFTEKTGGYE